MIGHINDFFDKIMNDSIKWEGVKPWFRGESGDEDKHPPLCPKIYKFGPNEENYFLQSFRRKAGGLANVPPRSGHTDMWLFLAQHYRLPTRLLDWTEGALHALYFAINRGNSNPRVYMLNPFKLNDLAGSKNIPPNFPLSWVKGGGLYVALAWQNRQLLPEQECERIRIGINQKIPLAFPAIYQDQRMIAQRSCFTIHGTELKSIKTILSDNGIGITDCLFEYKIDNGARSSLLKSLSILGISGASIFPDLDHLAEDLKFDIEEFKPIPRSSQKFIVEDESST